MKTTSFYKQIIIALVVAISWCLLPGSAHAALVVRKIVVIIPPPVPVALKAIVSR